MEKVKKKSSTVYACNGEVHSSVSEARSVLFSCARIDRFSTQRLAVKVFWIFFLDFRLSQCSAAA